MWGWQEEKNFHVGLANYSKDVCVLLSEKGWEPQDLPYVLSGSLWQLGEASLVTL